MGTNYKHLSCEERTMIQLSLDSGGHFYTIHDLARASTSDALPNSSCLSPSTSSSIIINSLHFELALVHY